MKLDIRKNNDPIYLTEVYSGIETRTDGYCFEFDIYVLPNGGWHVEYTICRNGQRIESGIKDFDTMLESFVWADSFFKGFRYGRVF